VSRLQRSLTTLELVSCVPSTILHIMKDVRPRELASSQSFAHRASESAYCNARQEADRPPLWCAIIPSGERNWQKNGAFEAKSKARSRTRFTRRVCLQFSVIFYLACTMRSALPRLRAFPPLRLASTVSELFVDLLRFMNVALRSRSSLIVENPFAFGPRTGVHRTFTSNA